MNEENYIDAIQSVQKEALEKDTDSAELVDAEKDIRDFETHGVEQETTNVEDKEVAKSYTGENYMDAIYFVLNETMKTANKSTEGRNTENDIYRIDLIDSDNDALSLEYKKDAKPDSEQRVTELQRGGPDNSGEIDTNKPKDAVRREKANKVDRMYLEMLKCRKLPDVLIIGFEKCGTVTLKSYLGIHPQIFIARSFENYKLFNKDSAITVKDYTKNLPCTPQGKLRLEKLATWGTVEKTAAVVPNAKLIAIVKEPVERSMSHYVHRMAKGVESTRYTFDTMIASIMDRDKPIPLKTSVLFRQSQYIDRLKPWIEEYGLSNIHIVDGDNFVKNPAAELQDVENFLELKPYITENNFVYNPEKKFYCLKQDGNEACMTSKKGRPHPVMTNATRTRLQQHFKPYNEKLYVAVGRNFSWNY